MAHTPYLNLNDIYAYVGEKILNWSGYKQVSEQSEYAAYIGYYQTDSELTPSKLFEGASNIYLDVSKGQYDGDEIVNLIIPGLRDIYKEHRHHLQDDERLYLDAMSKEVPTFKNISEYNSIKYNDDITLYQFFGDITPYDVIHIPLKQFIEIINSNEMFLVELYPIKFMLKITYDKSDFYDVEKGEIITNVAI